MRCRWPRSSAATSTPTCSPGSPSSTKTRSSTCATGPSTAAVLTEADVAGRYTFAHALIEHALYDDLSAGRRGRTHRRGRGGARGALRRRSRRADRRARLPLGARHPAAGRGQGDRVRAAGGRSGAGAARARRGAALVPGCARSARPRPRPTTRAVGPRCSSGSATRNGRRAIPRTARRCSRPAASPTTSTRSTSSCAPRCGTTEGGTASSAGSTANASRCCKRALTRLGDADSPDRGPPAGAAVRRAHVGRRLRRAPVDGDRGRRHRAAHRRRRRAGRRDPALPRVDRDAADPRAPPRGGTPRRATSPTISATRSPASTPTTTGLWPRWRPATLATMRDARSPSSRPNPSGSGNRSTAGRSRTTGRGSGCSKATSTAAEQAATEALTLGTAAGYPGRRVHGLRRPAHRPCAGCRAGSHEMVPLIEQAVHDNPGLQIFRATLAFAKSFDESRRRGAPAPRRRGRRRLPDVRRRHLAGRPRPLGRPPPRAAAIDRRRRSCTNACCRGTTSSRPHTSRSHGGVAHYLGTARPHPRPPRRGRPVVRQALAFHEAMEAPFFVALTQTAWAGLLVDRDQPGDARTGASAGRRRAVPSRRERGYGYVERDARALLPARLTVPPTREPVPRCRGTRTERAAGARSSRPDRRRSPLRR